MFHLSCARGWEQGNSNFNMFHVACYFEQFWGISNPLFPVKNKETSGKTIITPFVFLFVLREKSTPKVQYNTTWKH